MFQIGFKEQKPSHNSSNKISSQEAYSNTSRKQKLYGNLGCKEKAIWDLGSMSICFQGPLSTPVPPNTQFITCDSHNMSIKSLLLSQYMIVFSCLLVKTAHGPSTYCLFGLSDSSFESSFCEPQFNFLKEGGSD